MALVPEGDLNPPEEARLLPLGAPVEGDNALFRGSLRACLEEAWAQPAEARAELSIWTEGRLYGPDEIEALRQAEDGA